MMTQQHMTHRCTLLWRQVEEFTKVIYLNDLIFGVNALRVDMP
jgi:hypothetical protein